MVRRGIRENPLENFRVMHTRNGKDFCAEVLQVYLERAPVAPLRLLSEAVEAGESGERNS